MLWNVWPVPSVCPSNMPELSSPNLQKSQSPVLTIFLILETHWAGTRTNPSTLCSYTLCFVCTVCNLAVLVYLLICLAKSFLLLLEANLCPRLSHSFELCHCTFLIIYMKVFLSSNRSSICSMPYCVLRILAYQVFKLPGFCSEIPPMVNVSPYSQQTMN